MKRTQSKVFVVLAGVALAVAGCGTSSETASEPSPSPSVEQHAAQAGEPDLVQVEGYEYSNLSAAEQEQVGAAFQSQVDAANAQMPGAIPAWSIHNVTGPEGVEVGLIQIQYSPELVSDPATAQAQMAAMVGRFAQQGGSVEYETVAGTETAKVALEDGSAAYAWFDGAVLFMVMGETESDSRGFAEALITA